MNSRKPCSTSAANGATTTVSWSPSWKWKGNVGTFFQFAGGMFRAWSSQFLERIEQRVAFSFQVIELEIILKGFRLVDST